MGEGSAHKGRILHDIDLTAGAVEVDRQEFKSQLYITFRLATLSEPLTFFEAVSISLKRGPPHLLKRPGKDQFQKCKSRTLSKVTQTRSRWWKVVTMLCEQT